MAVTKYTRNYDFEAFQTTAPSTPLPSAQVESELDEVKTVTDAIIDALDAIQNDDNTLGNAAVHVDAFSSAALALMGGSWTPKGAWITATAYVVGDVVSSSGAAYVCAAAHTSGTFATDLAAARWIAFSGDIQAATYDNTASGLDAVNAQEAIDELALMAGGYLSKSVAGAADVTLTAAEADNTVLNLTGLLTGNINVIVPAEKRRWLVHNATTGSFTVTVKTSAGTGIAVTQAKKAWLYGDGTDVLKFWATDDGGTGDMLAANNLSDLASAATARTNLGLGSAALLTEGTSANNLVQLDGSGNLPAVNGAALTGLTSGATEQQVSNMMTDSLRITVLEDGGFALIEDGFVDAFTDESGVDTANSTNEHHSALADLYTNTAAPTTAYANALGNGDRTVTMTVTESGIVWDSGTSSNLVDGAIASNLTDSVDVPIDTLDGTQKIVFDFASNKYVDEITMKCSIALNGTWKWQGSNNNVDNDYVDITSASFAFDSTSKAVAVSMPNSGYRYLRLVGLSGTLTNGWFTEVEFKIGAPSALSTTLINNAVSAEAEPTEIEILILHEPIDSVTLNTDFTAEVSIDGGVTYATATLADAGEYKTGVNILRDTVDVTSQTGTSIEYRLKTLNLKLQNIHGVALGWS